MARCRVVLEIDASPEPASRPSRLVEVALLDHDRRVLQRVALARTDRLDRAAGVLLEALAAHRGAR